MKLSQRNTIIATVNSGIYYRDHKGLKIKDQDIINMCMQETNFELSEKEIREVFMEIITEGAE